MKPVILVIDQRNNPAVGKETFEQFDWMEDAKAAVSTLAGSTFPTAIYTKVFETTTKVEFVEAEPIKEKPKDGEILAEATVRDLANEN